MNQAKNVVKQMNAEKEKRDIKNINALKNTEYSSVYSLVSFLASLFLLFTNGFMDDGILKNIVELIVILGMMVMCYVLTAHARKKCEREGEKYRSSEADLIVKMATNIGYLSPVICVIGWGVTLKGFELPSKIFFVICITILAFFAISTPCFELVKKIKKKCNK